MTFVDLVGGTVICGVLLVFVPRTSFMVLLVFYIRTQHLFTGSDALLGVASTLLLIGFFVGLVRDITNIYNTYFKPNKPASDSKSETDSGKTQTEVPVEA